MDCLQQRQGAYQWPNTELTSSPLWQPVPEQQAHVLEMPEDFEDPALESRWPAFFPSAFALVTTSDGKRSALERVVGASIVNRFPYVLALSLSNEELPPRRYSQAGFMEVLEKGKCAAIQFLAPGPLLDRALEVIHDLPDERSRRLEAIGSETREAHTNPSPVFPEAYMVYEARLVRPGKDFEGQSIYQTPSLHLGSHRLFFLEITAIQLRADIADGSHQIHWRSLPAWEPRDGFEARPVYRNPAFANRYIKPYTPHYVFPCGNTVSYQADTIIDGMAIKCLPPLAKDQVQVDNDMARWPCFFPSSLGLITTWMEDGSPNLMPCGSTTVLSRRPLVIAPCVSYCAINERYAPRASLNAIRKSKRFGCAVPFIGDAIVNAIKYAGNISISLDPDKIANSGLEFSPHEWAPLLPALPIHYDCEVVGEVRLGTHVMFLGEVRSIRARRCQRGQPYDVVSVGRGSPLGRISDRRRRQGLSGFRGQWRSSILDQKPGTPASRIHSLPDILPEHSHREKLDAAHHQDYYRQPSPAGYGGSDEIANNQQT